MLVDPEKKQKWTCKCSGSMLSIAVTMESLVNVAAVVVTRNQSYNETIEQPLGRSMSIKSENDGRRQLFHIA